MNDDDTEIDVRQITIPDNAHSVFLGSLPTFPAPVSLERILAAWAALWRRAGVEETPPLLLIPRDFQIEAISDADLRRLGFMRAPPENE